MLWRVPVFFIFVKTVAQSLQYPISLKM